MEAPEKFRVAGYDGAEAFAAAEDAGFDRAQGGAGHGGDLVVGETVEVGEEDCLALVEGKLEEGAFEFGGKGGVVERFGGARGGVGGVEGRRFGVVAGGEGVGAGPAAAAAKLIAGLVDGDAEEPAAKGALLEACEAAISGEEGLLGGVFGGGSFAEEAEAEGVDGGLVAVDEPVEGVEIAVFR